MSKPGDHTIVEATEPLPAQEDQEDGPLYVHFLPRKEYLAAGTPWIVHSRYGCHPVAHVQFESVLGMTTGEGQPPVKVCLCGVSNHHLQVRRAPFPGKFTAPESSASAAAARSPALSPERLLRLSPPRRSRACVA